MTDLQAFVRRYIDDFINAHNLSTSGDLFTPTVIFHDPLAPGGVVQGIEEVRAFVGAIFEGLPDLRFNADAILEDGDTVGWHGSAWGTHQGPLTGVPPTGEALTVPIAEFYRLADGKIAEAWVFTDTMSILQQIGAIPTLA